MRFSQGSNYIIAITGVENRINVCPIIELTLVHLVSDFVNLVNKLVRSCNLLLNHHVSRFTLDFLNFVLIDMESDLIDQGAHTLLYVRNFSKFANDPLVQHLRLMLLIQNFEPFLLDMVHHLFGFFDLFVKLIEQILGGLQNLVEGLSVFDIHFKNIENVLNPIDGLLDVLVLLLSDKVNDFHDFVLQLLVALLAQKLEAV